MCSNRFNVCIMTEPVAPLKLYYVLSNLSGMHTFTTFAMHEVIGWDIPSSYKDQAHLAMKYHITNQQLNISAEIYLTPLANKVSPY